MSTIELRDSTIEETWPVTITGGSAAQSRSDYDRLSLRQRKGPRGAFARAVKEGSPTENEVDVLTHSE